MNAADLVLDPVKVRERPDAPALLYNDEAVSYAELLASVNRFGNGLVPSNRGDNLGFRVARSQSAQ